MKSSNMFVLLIWRNGTPHLNLWRVLRILFLSVDRARSYTSPVPHVVKGFCPFYCQRGGQPFFFCSFSFWCSVSCCAILNYRHFPTRATHNVRTYVHPQQLVLLSTVDSRLCVLTVLLLNVLTSSWDVFFVLFYEFWRVYFGRFSPGPHVCAGEPIEHVITEIKSVWKKEVKGFSFSSQQFKVGIWASPISVHASAECDSFEKSLVPILSAEVFYAFNVFFTVKMSG